MVAPWSSTTASTTGKPPSVPEPATLAYKASLTHLRTTVAAHVGQVFADLPSHDQAGSDRFITATVPVVAAAQGQAVALTAAYLGQILPEVAGADVEVHQPTEDDLVGAEVRNGTQPGDVYRRTFVGLWAATAAGMALERALGAAQARIEQTVDTDIGLSARAASQEILSATDGVERYERVSSGGCDLCEADDGATYSTDDLMPLHPSCQCVSEPVPGDPPVKETEEDADTIDVVDHDELGPLLVAKGDKFTPERGE